MAIDILKRLTQGIRLGKAEEGPRWRTPAVLDQGPLGEARLALDGRGHGTALWENRGEIWSMGIGPQSTKALMRMAMGEGTTPRVVMNPEGRGIALWQSRVGEERQILGRILGGGQSIAQVVFRTSGDIHHLQAAVDRRGNALVVWLHEAQGAFEVKAQSFDIRSASWEQESATLGVPSIPGAVPRVAANHREHAMVLWEVEGAFEGLVASHFWPSERIWSDRPVPVVAHATRHHQVAMDDQGNALALWVHAPYGQRAQLEASYYDGQACEWGPPEVLATAQTLSSPRLVMTGEGEALAAWCQVEGHGASRLFAKTFRRGRWESGMECLELGHGPVQDFAIGLGADGRAGLLSVQRGPEGDWVSARLRQGEWSAPVQLVAPSRAPCTSPRLAFCPQGVSAVWMHGAGREMALMLTETR